MQACSLDPQCNGCGAPHLQADDEPMAQGQRAGRAKWAARWPSGRWLIISFFFRRRAGGCDLLARLGSTVVRWAAQTGPSTPWPALRGLERD